MLANSATKPAGTTMLSRVRPICHDIGRWSTAVSGPFFRKYRSGESTAFGVGGTSGRMTSSPALGVVDRCTVSVVITADVSLRGETAESGRAVTAVLGGLAATAAVGARTTLSVAARGESFVALSTATS